MFTLIVALTVKDKQDVAKVGELLTQAAALSRQEPGCLRFEVYHSNADETKYFLCEHWDQEESLNQHRTRQAYTTIYVPQVLPLVTREGHPTKLVSS